MQQMKMFQTAGKLQGTLTDNTFKQVQNAPLAVISNYRRISNNSYKIKQFQV